jgi:hypothetical protein
VILEIDSKKIIFALSYLKQLLLKNTYKAFHPVQYYFDFGPMILRRRKVEEAKGFAT